MSSEKGNDSEENKWPLTPECVIKLKIVNTGEVRRISARSLMRYDKKIAYQRLIVLAVNFFQGEDFDIDASPEDFTVKASYIDDEGDRITFSSDRELLEGLAVLQSLRKKSKCLRLEAYVDRKSSSSDTKQLPEAESDKIKKNLSEIEERMEKIETNHDMRRMRRNLCEKSSRMDGQTGCLKYNFQQKKANFCGGPMRGKREFMIQMFQLLESLMKLLTSAIIALQNHLANNTSMDTMPSPKRPNDTENNKTKEKTENVQDPSNSLKSNTEPLFKEVMALKKAQKLLFNRHLGIRCDECAMDPIVGNRFHAKPDYDLCNKCHKKSKKNIEFEVIKKPIKRFRSKTKAGDTKNSATAVTETGQDPSISSESNEKSIEFEAIKKSKSKTKAVDTLYSATAVTETVHDPSNFSESNTELLLKEVMAVKKTQKLLFNRHHGVRCDECAMYPIVGNRFHAKPDYDLCSMCHKKNEKNIEFEVIKKSIKKLKGKTKAADTLNSATTTVPEKMKKFCSGNMSSTFVHRRHTCDGCVTTPIIGLRYNALNMKNYDLCASCFSKYEGNDIVFECVESGSDRCHQKLWENYLDLSLDAVLKKQKGEKQPRQKNILKSSSKVKDRLEDETGSSLSTEKIESGVDEVCISKIASEFVDAVLLSQVKETLNFFNSSKSVGDGAEDIKSATEHGKDAASESDFISSSVENEVVKALTETQRTITNDEVKVATLTNLAYAYNKPANHEKETEVEDSTIDEKEFEVEEESTKGEKSKTSEINISSHVPKNSTINESLSITDKTEDETKFSDGMTENEECSESNISVSSLTDGILFFEDEVASVGTSDEWDIVDEEKDRIQNDKTLARAAQMVGSALFEEDQHMSSEIQSTTSTGSNLSMALLNRWGGEVLRLRELGFMDDKKSIDVLEGLQAANIGVGCNDPIKIEKVVDMLLK